MNALGKDQVLLIEQKNKRRPLNMPGKVHTLGIGSESKHALANAFEIHTQMSVLVKTERKITLQILELINFCFARKAHLELGYGSLFDWLVSGHGYSESAAQRRIQAAKLLRSTPEVAAKIESGSVNLTTLARTQTFLQTHEKISGDAVSFEDRAKLVEKIENQTAKEAEKSLSLLLPEVAETLESHKPVAANAIKLSEEVLADLERAKEILSHVYPDGNPSEVLGHILEDFLQRKDPLRKEAALPPEMKNNLKSTAGAAKRCVANAKNISASTRRLVLQQARGCCEYRSPVTGKICGSRYQVQVDHVNPKALGGPDTAENLRALCAAHNRDRAARTFGKWPRP